MVRKEEQCNMCGQKLSARENDGMLLLVCVNQECENHWQKDNSEIILVLD
jgi:hypothetical protein